MNGNVRRQRGAALLEALIAILVFSFGVLGIVALEASATQFSVDAEDRTRAALFASELATQMWASNTTALDADTLSAWQARVEAAGSGLPSASASSVVDPATGLATITITWKAPWRKRSEQTNTYSTKVMLP